MTAAISGKCYSVASKTASPVARHEHRGLNRIEQAIHHLQVL